MAGVAIAVIVVALLLAWSIIHRRARAELARELAQLGGERDSAFFLHCYGDSPISESWGPHPTRLYLGHDGLLLDFLRQRVPIRFEAIVDASIEPSPPSPPPERAHGPLLTLWPFLHLEFAADARGGSARSVMSFALQAHDDRRCAEAIVAEVRKRQGHPEPVELFGPGPDARDE